MARKLTLEQDREIVQMYREGTAVAEIAERFGCGHTAIYSRLYKAGISPITINRRGKVPPRRFTVEQEQEIATLYANGTPLQHLTTQFDCADGTIHKVLERQGVPRRPTGGQVRKFTDEQVQDIAARWHAGESQRAIAQAYNTQQSVISRVLLLHGITPKSRNARQARHGMWKGGRVKIRAYDAMYVPPDSPYAPMRNTGGYVLEHRLVMAQHLGRPLYPWETVHHIDGDKANNQIENLQLRSGYHGTGIAFCCADCGSRNVVPCPLE